MVCVAAFFCPCPRCRSLLLYRPLVLSLPPRSLAGVSSCRFPFLCALCPRPAAVFSGTSAAADVFLLGFPICSLKILKVSCGSLCVSAGNWCAIVSMVLALLYLQWYYTYIGRTNKDQITGHVSMFNVCFSELSI